jgi:bidirectional [NiFe] hydrogenase diaphorase subunit
MNQKSFTINGHTLAFTDDETILSAARRHGLSIPTLCYEQSLSVVAACRLCLVEVEGNSRPVPACGTLVQEGMVVSTDTDRLIGYRRMILELLFSEGNHVCSACVSNGHCELQSLAYKVGMTHVRFDYLHPTIALDASHDRFAVDRNRCVLCTRCVRVCEEIEGAHTWDVMNRGIESRVIADMNQPWGESSTCTSCGKCVDICPTGALFRWDASVGQLVKHPEVIDELRESRRARDDQQST